MGGEIESLGQGVNGMAVGDRLMAGCRFGGYSDLVVTGAGELAPLREGRSFEQGASRRRRAMLRLWDAKGSLDEYVQPLAQWAAEGRISPVVAESFPLERGAEVYRYLQERLNIKVVLHV